MDIHPEQTCINRNWFNLLDLHTVLEILLFLDCKALSKVRQVNVSLSIVARTLNTRIPHWKTVHYEKEDGLLQMNFEDYDDTLEKIHANTTSFSNVGFLFCESKQLNKKALDKFASKLHPRCCLIGGCINAILSVDNTSGKDSIIRETEHVFDERLRYTLSLSNMPDTVCAGFHVDVREEEEMSTALDSIPAYTPTSSFGEEGGREWKVIILLIDYRALKASTNQWIKSIQRKFPKVQVVGGVLGGVKNTLCIVQNQKVKIYEGGIVGMCIGGNTIFSSQVSRGCREITPITDVVETDDFLLKTLSINGVKRSAASLAAECPTIVSVPFLGVSSDLSIGFTLYDVEGTTPDGAVLIRSDELKSAKYVQVFDLDPETSKEDLKNRLDEARKKCASLSKQVLGGLLFTCNGRGSKLYADLDVESTIFAQAMPNIGLSGFFAGGEIGPEALAAAPPESEYRREAIIQGFTAVFGIFFVPKYYKPSGKIVDEAIAARNLFF